MKRWRKLKRVRKTPAISNVEMDSGQGTFIPGTGGATVGEVRADSKKKNTVMVKEDLLHRRISEYRLVTPARAQNPVWFFSGNTVPRSLRTTLLS